MRDLVVGPFKSVIRIAALVRKELIQVRRRPGAFLSLVFGPFLIMAIFGLGYTGERKPLDTIIVVPTNLGLSRDVAFYQSLAGPALNIRAVSDDADTARALLAAQQLDLVVIAPADAEERFRAGQQAQIEVELNAVDPVQAGYAEFIASVVNRQINEEIIRRAVEEGQAYTIGDEPDVTRIPPEVIASPTIVKVTNLAPTLPNVVSYSAPAALALMLQHMAITLTALSFVRERLSGALELFRISPVTSLELVLAKYIGLGLVSAVVAVISVLLLVGVLGVPCWGASG